ncbi:MAG: hypothetical protein AB1801_07535 [Chloroflexota bacterium]
MRILAIAMAALVFVAGFRLITVAIKTALSGKVLVRQGLRSDWQRAPDRNEALKIAFRDGLMGLLLIVLGVFLLT